MRRSALLLAVCAALASAACGGAAAQVILPSSGPLAVPPAPSHVVVPAEPEPTPVPVIETPTTQSLTPVTSGAGNARTREVPPPRPTAPPAQPPATQPATPPTTPTPLPAAPNQGELEQQARSLVASADQTLDKIDYKALNADGRAQFDTAKRFVKQADDALKARNIVYAWQLANKANTIATMLK